MSGGVSRELRGTRLASGHSLLESAVAMVLLAVGVVVLGSMEAAGARAETARERRDTAIGIARDNTRMVEELDYDRLIPTEGFEAPPWLAEPGAAFAEWFVRRSENEALSELAQATYEVSWRVENAGGSPLLRRVHLRVGWRDSRRRVRHFTLTTVRAR